MKQAVYIVLLLALFCSCENTKPIDKTVYFGGEIENPISKTVLLRFEDQVIDTAYLDENNFFMFRVDSTKYKNGMYNFLNGYEFQWVYMDQGDSILIHTNGQDFDNSLVFSGEGAEKNNFLIDLYLIKLEQRQLYDSIFELPVEQFLKGISGLHYERKAFFKEFQERSPEISKRFTSFIDQNLNYHYYGHLEVYPYINMVKSGVEVLPELPDDYYDFRNNTNLNNRELWSLDSYQYYLESYFTNIVMDLVYCEDSDCDIENYAKYKVNAIVEDIKEPYIKEQMLLSAFSELFVYYDPDEIKDEVDMLQANIRNDENRFHVEQAINNFNNIHENRVQFPSIKLTQLSSKRKVSSDSFRGSNTLIYFWNLSCPKCPWYIKKLSEMQKEYPDFRFVIVNTNEVNRLWKDELKKLGIKGLEHYQFSDFSELESMLFMPQPNMSMVLLDENGVIKNNSGKLLNVHYLQEQLDSTY